MTGAPLPQERNTTLVQVTEIKAPVDAKQQVIRRNVVLKVDRVEQPLPSSGLASHHLEALRDQHC
jgi:hypothetical protein